MSEIPDFVQRMIDEHDQLKARLEKLQAFMASPRYQDLFMSKRLAMHWQEDVMQSYLHVLAHRISLEMPQ